MTGDLFCSNYLVATSSDYNGTVLDISFGFLRMTADSIIFVFDLT